MTETNMPEAPAERPQFVPPSGYSTLRDFVDTSLWPDLPQVDNDDLVNEIFAIVDARLLTYNKETGPFFICKCLNPETMAEFTCALGGNVIPPKINVIADRKGFPVMVRMVKILSGAYANRGYFDIIDPGDPLPQKAQGSTGPALERRSPGQRK